MTAIYMVQPTWMHQFIDSYEGDTDFVSHLSLDEPAHSGYSFKNRLLFHKNRLYVGTKGDLKTHLLSLYHNSYLGGHLGINATYVRLVRHFYWPGTLKAVMDWVKKYDDVLDIKAEHCPSPGLLQPLPVPSRICNSVLWVKCSFMGKTETQKIEPFSLNF